MDVDRHILEGAVTIFGMDANDSDEAQAQYLDNGHHGPTCGEQSCTSHSFVLEHEYYKKAIAEKWPGWENANWIPMDTAGKEVQDPTPADELDQGEQRGEEEQQEQQGEQQEQKVHRVQMKVKKMKVRKMSEEHTREMKNEKRA